MRRVGDVGQAYVVLGRAAVRRFNPSTPDEPVLELAERMAVLRLLGEEIG